MVVFGGDPLVANGEFLNDLWRLKPSASDEVPSWQRIEALNASEDGKRPGLDNACSGCFTFGMRNGAVVWVS